MSNFVTRSSLLLSMGTLLSACPDHSVDKWTPELILKRHGLGELSDVDRRDLIEALLADAKERDEICYKGLEDADKNRIFQRLVESDSESNGSALYNIRIFHRYSSVMERYLGSAAGREILEIGPGHNLGQGALFVLDGVSKYHAVDIYEDPKLYDRESYEPILAWGERYFLDRQHPMSVTRGGFGQDIAISSADVVKSVTDGRVVLNEEKIKFHYPAESYELPVADNQIDFLFSNTCFEHFLKPKETIQKIYQVLKPGGVTAHYVDLRDHRDSGFPGVFEMLKFTEESWRKLHEGRMHHYTNRWRAVDFRRELEAAGFEVLEWNAWSPEGLKVTPELKAQLDERFQAYTPEELSEVWLWFVARKPTS